MNPQVEPPEKKRKRKKKTTPPPAPPSSSPSFSLLPDEITVNCLARISRAYYPRLSIISKTFRSILSSKDLYVARSHIGSTEQCLYVCLSDDKSPQWFTLWINPNPTLEKNKKKKKKTFGKLLTPIPPSDSRSVSEPALVVGSEIYVIGGPVKTEQSALLSSSSKFGSKWRCPSSTVRILDCRTHTWSDAPSMIVARKHALTYFCDGKIYVLGGCGDDVDQPWAEVFDTNTQTWKPLSDPGTEIRKIKVRGIYQIKEMKGKIYFCNTKSYAYDISHDSWESMDDGGVRYYRIPKSACEIDGVWYYTYDFISWTKDGRYWKGVKGLESLRAMYNRNGGGSSSKKTKLVSCGGKLFLMWEGYMKHNPSNRKKIWCAEITLETGDESEVCGNVEWIDVVQSVPTQCALLHCLVVSV